MQAYTPQARPTPSAGPLQNDDDGDDGRPGGSKLRIVQLNCNLRATTSAVLATYMAEERVQIALLQEHHVQPATGLPTGFPRGMRAFSNAAAGRENKAAVVIADENIEAVPMGPLVCQYGTAVWTKGPYGELVVCSMYCKWRSELGPYVQYMEAVLAEAGPTPVLFGMDANARSPMWHSKVRVSVRGRELYGDRGIPMEEAIVRHQLAVLNEPSVLYTFCGARGVSDIDLTIGNDALRRRFSTSWRIDPEAAPSDHNAIVVCLQTGAERVEPEPLPVRWSARGADWRLFEERARATLADADVDALTADELERLLDAAATVACDAALKREQLGAPRRQTWWTRELFALRRQVRRARRMYQRARRRTGDGPALTPEVVETRRVHRALERAYERQIQAAKAEDWRRFVGSVGNDNPWGAVYRICRKGSASTTIGRMQRPGGGATTTWAEAADVLLQRFLPEAVAEPAEGMQWQPPVAPDPVSMEEIGLAVARNNPRRAPGLDGKRGGVVRHLFAAAPGIILALLNKCLTEGCFPAAWKEGRLVVLLKGAGRDVSDPGSYRPITLLSVLGKTFERVLVGRLRAAMPPQSPTQFGFTAGRSTVDAWMSAKELVAGTGTRYVLGVFVDFVGAFDNITWSSILLKLREVGCRELATWRSYFRGRRSCLVGRQDTVWRDAARGCPQGSICGPTMWNLLMNDLLVGLSRHGVPHVAFADDLLLVIAADSRTALERQAAFALQLAADWGAEAGVKISLAKTEALMLRGSLDAGRLPVVALGGQRIVVRQRVKYLGVWVSAGMHFEGHLRELRAKLVAVVSPLHRVLRKSWGLRRKAVNAWMSGLLKPVVMYAVPVWHEAAVGVKGVQRMAALQRVALLACIRVCRTVSTVAMQVLANAVPWDLEALRLVARYKASRLIAPSRHDVLTMEEVVDAGWRQLLDQRIADAWQRRWNEAEHGRVTHRYIGVVGSLSAEAFDPPTRAMFLLTGHGSMNDFLRRRVNREQSAACRCGAEVEDWQHVLVSCVRYADLRNLGQMAVREATDGQLDVSLVLGSQDSYEAFVAFADAAFRRRKQDEIDAARGLGQNGNGHL